MNAFLIKSWLYARESMWIVPATMTLLAVGIAFGLVEFDQAHTGKELSYNWFVYGGNPVGARSILSTIASSMITIAGVAFSLNLVTLTLASSQYGPRLLRNFIKDLGNQLVLGTFIATFVYSLIVLLSIRSSADEGFVPQTAVAFAFVMALASLAVLIYFIHHNSSSIQADHIIRSAYNDLVKAIDNYAGKKAEHKPDTKLEEELERLNAAGYHIFTFPAPHTGYIQAIDSSSLSLVCERNDIVVKLDRQVGDFIIEGEQIGEVYAKMNCKDDILEHAGKSVVMGIQRTSNQDVEFPINQIVEIAVRALSPGVNDPNTAITCIHWLGAAMARFAALRPPDNLYYDENKKLRVVQQFHDFDELLEYSFNDIRFHATGNPNVSRHILKVLHQVLTQVSSPGQINKIIEMGRLVARVNEHTMEENADIDMLIMWLRKLEQAATQKTIAA